IGKNVHGGVRNEQRFRVRRNVHDEDVAYPSLRAEPGFASRDLSEKLVRVQAAFHNELDATTMDQRDRFGRGGVAVKNVDNLVRGDVDTKSLGHVAYFP